MALWLQLVTRIVSSNKTGVCVNITLLITNFSTERVMLRILGKQDDTNESHHEVNKASNHDLGVVISDDELFDSRAEGLDNEDEGTNESLTALEILNMHVHSLKVKEEAMVSTRGMKLITQASD